jgi:hypothetical protein
MNGGTLSVDSVIANVLSSESGALVSIHSGGGITASSLGSGSLMLSGSPGSPAILVSTVSGLGTLQVGPLTLNGYSTLNMVAGTTISSLGNINILGLGNVLNVSGSFGSGTYTLVSGSSLSVTGISLTGVAVGGGTIALDSTATAGRASYAFTKTPVALQVVVVGVPWNIAFNGSSGSWNTNPSNLSWQTLVGKTNTSFYPNDNVYFTNGATVAVAAEGVAPGNMTIVNPAGTTVSLNGGTISAASLNASGAGTATIAGSMNIAAGATFAAGAYTLASNLTIASKGLALSSGSLVLGGSNTIAGGVTVTGGSLTDNGGMSVSSGDVTVIGGILKENSAMVGCMRYCSLSRAGIKPPAAKRANKLTPNRNHCK